MNALNKVKAKEQKIKFILKKQQINDLIFLNIPGVAKKMYTS